MLFRPPPEHDYDLKFRLFSIPVRIHPGFWLVSGILGLSVMRPSRKLDNLFIFAAWVLAVLVAILVHELGHAGMGRLFGSRRVHIVLHAMGGLAIGADGRNRRERVLVILGGPVAGILLGVVALGVFLGAAFVLPERALLLVGEFFGAVAWVGLGWGLINLLPIHPLDGGQVCLEIVEARRPFAGRALAYKISMITAIVVAALFASRGYWFATFLFGYLAYQNYRNLSGPTYR